MIYPAQHAIVDLYNPTASERSFKPPAPARRLSIGPKSLCDAIEVRPPGLDWQLLSLGRPIVGNFPANVPIEVRAPSIRPRGAAGVGNVIHSAEIEIDDFGGSELLRKRAPFLWRQPFVTAGGGPFVASHSVGRLSGRRRIWFYLYHNVALTGLVVHAYMFHTPAAALLTPMITVGALPAVGVTQCYGWVTEDPCDAVMFDLTSAAASTGEINMYAED